MKKYQNVLAQRDKSEFVEVVERGGEQVVFSASSNNVKRGSVTADIVSAKVVYSKPLVVSDCVNTCVTAEFNSGFTLSFNVKKGDVAALDALEAEALRLFAVARTNLVYGIVPSASAEFPKS